MILPKLPPRVDGEPEKTLLVVTGPTASGKTSVSIDLAKHFGAEIISADSRQIFREIPIGTAAPVAEELAAVPHHFVGVKNLTDYYSAAEFEADVMELLPRLFEKNDVVVLCGGSMMYVDAVVNGIDDIPTISDRNRRAALEVYNRGGIQRLRLELLDLDPVYYREVDLNNPKRLIHALEIIYESGCRYSLLRTGKKKKRDFRVVKYGLRRNREDLFDRINRRVDSMIASGLLEEARRVVGYRSLNSLNTVGYKELFAFFDGLLDFPTAVERIKKNTRVYAKKQMRWLERDPEINWIDLS